jgi:hypothetical protein
MFAGVIGVVAIAVVVLVAVVVFDGEESDRRQEDLQSFYDTPNPLPDVPPGAVLRIEALTEGVELTNATAWRILYRTEDSTGAPRVSGGRLFIPSTPAPPQGRPVVSWAHPTTGMGDACAPSRTPKPTDLLDWLPAMLDRGWVVVATDYAGLGTEGVESYLVAESEVRDVVNAVRAARNVPEADASDTYGVFGHSQGGHAALWAGTLAPSYAPELTIVGVAGAAPAAPLAGLVEELWDSDLGWLIGAEVVVSYPANYPELDPADVLTDDGLRAYADLAEKCLDTGGAESEIRQRFQGDFFATNPLDNAEWSRVLRAQSAPPVPSDIPVLVTQSVNDGVIASKVIARMTDEWCAAGSAIETVWLGPLRGSISKPTVLTHIYEGAIGGAVATTWLEERFAGEPAPTSCGQTAPIVASSDGADAANGANASTTSIAPTTTGG